MKIAVIGTFVLDNIYSLDGSHFKSLGGISYTISMLANILDSNDEIIPIASVGADAYDQISGFLKKYPNVTIAGLNKVKERNTRVTLKYKTKESREETLKNVMPAIQFDQIASIDVDVILINFITGFEMDSETCNRVCNEIDALSYMDYHSLCLGIDKDGKRFHRKPENWKKWVKGLNILQMNETEANILSDDYKNFSSFGNEIIKNSVKILNITRGSKGSLLFSNETGLQEIAPTPADTIDVTGCGDAFAAGFIVDYLKNSDPLQAARHANRIAGFNSTISGIENISLLKEFLHQ